MSKNYLHVYFGQITPDLDVLLNESSIFFQIISERSEAIVYVLTACPLCKILGTEKGFREILHSNKQITAFETAAINIERLRIVFKNFTVAITGTDPRPRLVNVKRILAD